MGFKKIKIWVLVSFHLMNSFKVTIFLMLISLLFESSKKKIICNNKLLMQNIPFTQE